MKTVTVIEFLKSVYGAIRHIPQSPEGGHNKNPIIISSILSGAGEVTGSGPEIFDACLDLHKNLQEEIKLLLRKEEANIEKLSDERSSVTYQLERITSMGQEEIAIHIAQRDQKKELAWKHGHWRFGHLSKAEIPLLYAAILNDDQEDLELALASASNQRARLEKIKDEVLAVTIRSEEYPS